MSKLAKLGPVEKKDAEKLPCENSPQWQEKHENTIRKKDAD